MNHNGALAIPHEGSLSNFDILFLGSKGHKAPQVGHIESSQFSSPAVKWLENFSIHFLGSSETIKGHFLVNSNLLRIVHGQSPDEILNNGRVSLVFLCLHQVFFELN